jgi:hypothetical protein
VSQDDNIYQDKNDEEIDFITFFGDDNENNNLEKNLSDDLAPSSEATAVDLEATIPETSSNEFIDSVESIGDSINLTDVLESEHEVSQEPSIDFDESFEFNSELELSPKLPFLVDSEISPVEPPIDLDSAGISLETARGEKKKRVFLWRRLLSFVIGSKPVGVEGMICAVVFFIFLLWLCFMNIKGIYGRPVGIGFNTLVWYVVLMNLFGFLGLLVPAWMFFNRGTDGDKRDMKDRNNVFRVMLGGGIIFLSVGVILLMTEYFRYDFTVKAGDPPKVQTIDGNTKIPEIKPNSLTLEPIP